MGFRFRRSVKLIPGLRLNISTGGASLSFGGPGATLNFSKRGTRATFGLPGTGLSWSQSLSGNLQRPSGREKQIVQPGAPINTIDELESVINDPGSSVVYSRSGRRLSAQQIEAMRQRLLDKQRREAASAQLAATEVKKEGYS